MKRLIINADDFGFARDVNEGIVAAHRGGLLRATTLMANGEAFDHAVELSREDAGLDVGCHLVLVQGESVARPGEALPETIPELLWALQRRRLDVRAEVNAQIEKIMGAGIKPLHADTHKHTHLHPQVMDAVAAATEAYGIAYVRQPFDWRGSGVDRGASLSKRVENSIVQRMRPRVNETLRRHGRRSTDHFIGFQLTGRFTSADLEHLFTHLPEGTTEFMCHVGYCTDELRGMPTRLKESREAELSALLAPSVKRAVDGADVVVSGYRELATA